MWGLIPGKIKKKKKKKNIKILLVETLIEILNRIHHSVQLRSGEV
jgi:hypothetical protein